MNGIGHLPTQVKPVKQQQLKEEKRSVFTSPALCPNPSEKDYSISFSVGVINKLKAKDIKKNQIYEFEDYADANCNVVAFKKISTVNPHTRLNCFVTSFPFSGHCSVDDKGNETYPPIMSKIENQEDILHKLAAEEESPFVFMMNQLKYE
jgi:hypothetical protein